MADMAVAVAFAVAAVAAAVAAAVVAVVAVVAVAAGGRWNRPAKRTRWTSVLGGLKDGEGVAVYQQYAAVCDDALNA